MPLAETAVVMSEKQYLLDRTLEAWKGKRVAVGIGSDASFSGILVDFDDEVVLLRDVTDYAGNKAKELLVKIDDLNWITLLR
jgi:small nuclear ribonucleoprotein (snRNP)-like protein